MQENFTRSLYMALFIFWSQNNMYSVHKSFKDSNGNTFPDGQFVVVAQVSGGGQMARLFPASDWERCIMPEQEESVEIVNDMSDDADNLQHINEWIAGQ